MWPLGHVGHVDIQFHNFAVHIKGIFDDKLRPQIVSVGTTANSPLRYDMDESLSHGNRE